MARFGEPAEVKKILIPSSKATSIESLLWANNKGRLMPMGLSVNCLAFLIWSRNKSADMLPAPINPKPPSLETAAARRAPLLYTMPPWTIGYSIPKREQVRLFCQYFFMLLLRWNHLATTDQALHQCPLVLPTHGQ